MMSEEERYKHRGLLLAYLADLLPRPAPKGTDRQLQNAIEYLVGNGNFAAGRMILAQIALAIDGRPT